MSTYQTPLLPLKNKKKRGRDFYKKDALTLAIDLLGDLLVFEGPQGQVSGIINETEAYLGEADPACHTFGGKMTSRTQTMFEEGGLVYIYLIYGIYNCLNVVSGLKGSGEAVLIRSVIPMEGLEIMRINRGLKIPEKNYTNGPGKLCKAFNIDRTYNGGSFLNGPIAIYQKEVEVQENQIDASPRIGIEYAGDAAFWPLRFQLLKN